jgi:molybdenum cofactor cytidylyltransferase
MQRQVTPDTLWSALDLDAAPVPVVAIVGGGGKTALLYRLGREAAAAGRRAVLGGTTRFTRAPAAEMPPLVEAEEGALPAAIVAALRAHAVVVASAGDLPQGRLGPMEPATAGAIAALPGLGLLALEADGSKILPFKAPADHEPVVPPAATHVVAVVGVDALDAPLDAEHVHRPERVRAIVGDAPSTCDAALIARVLADPRGGRKHVGARRFAVLVNKADLAPGRALALAEALRAAGVERVVVASLRDAVSPVRAALVAAPAAGREGTAR